MKNCKKKMIKRIMALTLAVSVCFGAVALQGVWSKAEEVLPIWLDKDNYSFEERAAALVAQMSLQEELSQMISSFSPAIPRLGIAPYAWWNEALHGVSRIGTTNRSNPTVIYNTTSYPIGLSMGSAWDADLMYRVAAAIGDESREVAPDNDRMLTMYSPTVNLARDPRWGRNDEAFSEDPYLTAAIASQFVNGLEGKDKSGNPLDPNGYLKAVATIKHYLANNSEINRLNGSSNMTEQELREYYSYVYRLIIQQTDVTSVMSAYNRIQVKDPAYSDIPEVPGGFNEYMLDTLLRQTMGFSGYVTSDCDSVHIGMNPNPNGTPKADQKTTSGNGQGWRVPGVDTNMTYAQADAWAIMSGADLECNTGYGAGNNSYENAATTQAAIADGYVTPSGKMTKDVVDVDAWRLFTARFKLGEFDDKAEDQPVSWYNEARERIESNYGEDWVFNMGNTDSSVTMTTERLNLAREAAAKSMILLKNDPVGGNKLLPVSVPTTGAFKVAVYGFLAKPNSNNEGFFMGGYSPNRNEGGYAKMVTPYTGIKRAIEAINPNAQVDYFKGFTNGTSCTSITNLATSEIDRAGDYDLVIAVVGDDTAAADEGSDRSDILLKGAQSQLLTSLAEKNPKLVTVIQAFCSIDTTAFDSVTPALLFSSFNGDRNGEGIADVLLGDYNPSGRTSTVWHKDIGQIGSSSGVQTATRSYRLSPGEDGPWKSPYGTQEGTEYSYGEVNGRTYMYYDETSAANAASGNTLAHSGGPVRYPFGYGLSYTTFAYSNLGVTGLTGDAVDANGQVTLTFDVKNTGTVKGKDVAELFVKTPASLVASDKTYAIKRLKGYQQVELEPGETKSVSISVDIADLAFYSNEAKKFQIVNGIYDFQISRSSSDSDVQLVKSINITGQLVPGLSVLSLKPNTASDKNNDVPQRLIYSVGDVVNPNPTINMTNDVMYGYINKSNPGQPIPSNIKITYTSNRPEVVSVNGGEIETVNEGVATITAVATDSISDTTVSEDFIVYVEDEYPELLLSSIKIGGTEIDGFKPGKYNYDIFVPESEKAVPQVTAETKYAEDVDIAITQAAALPGTAVITVALKNDPTTKRVYTLNFGSQTIDLMGTCDSSGFNVTSNVRFSDGVTEYRLTLAVFDENDKMVLTKTQRAEAFPKNGGGVVNVYVDPGRELGEKASICTYKAFLWAPGDTIPYVQELSLRYNK